MRDKSDSGGRGGGDGHPPLQTYCQPGWQAGAPQPKKIPGLGKAVVLGAGDPPQTSTSRPAGRQRPSPGLRSAALPRGGGGCAAQEPRRSRAGAAQEPYRGVRGRGSRVAHPTARGAVHPHPRGLRRTGIWGEAAA